MLANLKDVFAVANEKNIAIGAFNVVHFEHIQAILDAAQTLHMPAILAFAQTHEENDMAYLDEIGPVMVWMARRADVPVVVHLDHGVNLSYIERALQLGFTSCMFDGSALPYDENVALTKQAVAMARRYHVSIEAEIGQMAGITLNNEGVTENRVSDRRMYTDPQEAKDFVEKTGVDCLAASFGTVHGVYFSKPHLDFDLIKELHDVTGVPIVMHGGSGVSFADYKKVIANGVRKINYYTYMDKAGADAINRSGPYTLFSDAAKLGRQAMEKDVEAAMRCFVNMDA